MWTFCRRLGLVLKREQPDPAEITLVVEGPAPGAACPLCGRFSVHRHCQYGRCLLDLPADGRKVVLHLRVRKFRCTDPDCRRRVFAEQLSGLIRPHERRREWLDRFTSDSAQEAYHFQSECCH
ncbi:MAG: transposase [Firmicutes bacterium]|nr:transposase [Bacillota bacterium]